ncbi:MAG TPA: NUDIX domain-containing protein [Chloroflexota bacterium]|nr:NUDIX domain-containing protein [Chloroflexota bacterium]
MASTHFYYGSPPPETNRPLRLGVTALIVRPSDGALLLDRRSDNGQWSVLGGALDPEEVPELALAREVREETGLTVVAHRLFGIQAHPTNIVAYPDGTVVRMLALVYVVSVAEPADPRMSKESVELRFLSRAEVRDLLISPSLTAPSRPILHQYLSGAMHYVG